MTPYEQQLASIGDSAAFFAAIDESAMHTSVPNCPGWDVRDVVWHVAWHGPASWIAVIEGSDPLAAIGDAIEAQPSITEALAGLVANLRAHEPTESCNGFFAPSDYASWGIHCSVEIALHRCDVASALGMAAELTASEARDG